MTIDRATVIALSSLLAGLLVTVGLSFDVGTGAINDYEHFVRYTARLAFFLFLPVFVLGALTQLTDIALAKALRPKRRLLGLTFGAAHLCHMVAILMLHNERGTWFTADDAAALVIYSLLVLQIATSNHWSVRALGRGWRALHWVATYAIFIGFFVTYLGRFQDIGGFIYGGLFALAASAWLLRIAAFVQKTRGRVPAAT